MRDKRIPQRISLGQWTTVKILQRHITKEITMKTYPAKMIFLFFALYPRNRVAIAKDIETTV